MKEENNNNKISPSVFREMFRNSVKIIKILWKEKKKAVIVLTLLFLLISMEPFISSGSQGLLINELVKSAGSGTVSAELILFIALVAFILFFSPLLFITQDYIENIFYFLLDEKFELMIIKKKSEIDVSTKEDPKQNDLFNKIQENGVWRIRNFTTRQFWLLQNLIETAIASAIILFFEWWIFLFIFLAVIPELVVETKYGKEVWDIHTGSAETRRKYWNLRSHFDWLFNLVELKLFQNVRYFLKNIQELYRNFIEEEKKSRKSKFLRQILTSVLSQGAIAFAIIFFILEVVKGNIQIGTLIFLIGSIWRFRNTLTSFFRNIGHQYQDSLFVSDMFKFLDISAALQKPENGIVLNSRKTPEIIFENVSFKYPGTEKLVLKNLSLKIEAGEKLAIIGVNGAGKTTLIKLLCRFYDPTEGRILIDGQDLKEIDLDSWYTILGTLFQDYSRYHFIVRDAIAVGKTSIEQKIKKVKDAAKAGEADVFIEEWEKSYDQMLGKEWSEGIEPSIGQWQKLALARAFYRDPKILILDEPTSSIDAEAEAKIFERLEALPKDRTVILISHRFSTVRHADKIAVIAEGKLKELGIHEELLQKNGIYARLFNLQAEGYK